MHLAHAGADATRGENNLTTDLTMNKEYYETISELQKRGVTADYITGWASGYLGSPKVEEQRLSEAYSAGYADGQARRSDGGGETKNNSVILER